MKYIMVSITTPGEGPVPALVRKLPVIFPNELVHWTVASALMPMLRTQAGTSRTVEITSAGDFLPSDILCTGSSETLNLRSDPSDTQIVRMHDYFHGIE